MKIEAAQTEAHAARSEGYESGSKPSSVTVKTGVGEGEGSAINPPEHGSLQTVQE